MTPKPRTLDDYMDGEYKDVNTGEIGQSGPPAASTHMYIIPDDLTRRESLQAQYQKPRALRSYDNSSA